MYSETSQLLQPLICAGRPAAAVEALVCAAEGSRHHWQSSLRDSELQRSIAAPLCTHNLAPLEDPHLDLWACARSRPPSLLSCPCMRP